MTSQQSRTIFITGSSSGLGRAAAKLFASRGWVVLATMRSPDKERDLSTLPNIVLLPLDITDPQQVTRAANDALARGPVDVVFNNAGYGMAGPLEGVTDDQMLRIPERDRAAVLRTASLDRRLFMRVNSKSAPTRCAHHWALGCRGIRRP